MKGFDIQPLKRFEGSSTAIRRPKVGSFNDTEVGPRQGLTATGNCVFLLR